MSLKSFQGRREIHSVCVTCAALEQLPSQASLHLPVCHLPGQSGIILANRIVNFCRDLNTVTRMLILLLLLSLRLNNFNLPWIVSEEHSGQGIKLDFGHSGLKHWTPWLITCQSEVTVCNRKHIWGVLVEMRKWCSSDKCCKTKPQTRSGPYNYINCFIANVSQVYLLAAGSNLKSYAHPCRSCISKVASFLGA